MDDRLRLDVRDTHLMVLTGAGISVESGLSTYRAMNGLWNEHPVKDVATPYGFEANPALAWRFWSERRAEAQRAQPNRGHAALVGPEELLAGRFLLVTQNVDGLHQRAGSQRVVELHGSLHRSRCSKCRRPPFADDALYLEGAPPRCDLCPPEAAGIIRPAVVWFAEPIAQPDMDRVERFMARAARGRFVFLAVGRMGGQPSAARLVDRRARASRAAGPASEGLTQRPPEPRLRAQRCLACPEPASWALAIFSRPGSPFRPGRFEDRGIRTRTLRRGSTCRPRAGRERQGDRSGR